MSWKTAATQRTLGRWGAWGQGRLTDLPEGCRAARLGWEPRLPRLQRGSRSASDPLECGQANFSESAFLGYQRRRVAVLPSGPAEGGGGGQTTATLLWAGEKPDEGWRRLPLLLSLLCAEAVTYIHVLEKSVVWWLSVWGWTPGKASFSWLQWSHAVRRRGVGRMAQLFIGLTWFQLRGSCGSFVDFLNSTFSPSLRP